MPFVCLNCEKSVPYSAPGTKNRNHCPSCLCSLHVDEEIGDRKSSCKGLMMPIGKVFKADGEEVLIHECEKCGFIRKNRVAGDDDYEKVSSLIELDAEEYL